MQGIPVEFAVPKKPYRVLAKIEFGEDEYIWDIAEYFGNGIWEKDNTIVNVTEWRMLPE